MELNEKPSRFRVKFNSLNRVTARNGLRECITRSSEEGIYRVRDGCLSACRYGAQGVALACCQLCRLQRGLAPFGRMRGLHDATHIFPA
jgi:hypothetical protein